MNRKTVYVAMTVLMMGLAVFGFNASVRAAADVQNVSCGAGFEDGKIVITNNKNGNMVLVCKGTVDNPLGRAFAGKTPCAGGEGKGHFTVAANGNATVVCTVHD